MADNFEFTTGDVSGDGFSGDGAVVFISETVEAGTRSAESLEAAGLEVIVAAATTETAATDDVLVDGKIITAENYDAAEEGSDLLIVNNGDGSDFLEIGGGDTDLLRGRDGNDILIGNQGNDFAPEDEGFEGSLVDGSKVADDGGEGDDQLIGDDGQYVLVGGTGNDTLWNTVSGDALVFTAAADDGGDADSADPVLMVISNQDFYYQEYNDTSDADAIPPEQIAFNYEEIKSEPEPVFDSFYDVI